MKSITLFLCMAATTMVAYAQDFELFHDGQPTEGYYDECTPFLDATGKPPQSIRSFAHAICYYYRDKECGAQAAGPSLRLNPYGRTNIQPPTPLPESIICEP
ncbi:unnamed protein product [Absidia cylindrospora]